MQNIFELIYDIWNVNIANVIKANDIASWARDMGVQRAELLWFYDEYGTLVTWDNEADAYRHFLWNARMTRELGRTVAAKIANRHEVVTWDSKRVNGGIVYFVNLSSLMDMYNNAVGREYAENNPNEDYVKLFSRAAFIDGALILELSFVQDAFGLSDWQIMTRADGTQYTNIYVPDDPNGQIEFLTYEQYVNKLGG